MIYNVVLFNLWLQKL